MLVVNIDLIQQDCCQVHESSQGAGEFQISALGESATKNKYLRAQPKTNIAQSKHLKG